MGLGFPGHVWSEIARLMRELLQLACAFFMQAEEERARPAPQEEEEVRVLTLPLQAHHAMEKMEEFVYKVRVPESPCAGGCGGLAGRVPAGGPALG